MDSIYYIILGILLVLAVFDLVVGVSNDAANFLNSAVGAKVAPRSVIVAIAAVGVVIGASFSSGMMEIARSGVFVPAQFSFPEIMMLFLAVMLTDVILLDLFNTFGLPTSTTVSLVFELLGSAVAIALFKMSSDPTISQSLGDFINSSKALGIISGIFASVGVAFTCGCIVMWISRLIFSFRYKKVYTYLGSIWCSIALTSITYFAVFKGLKGSTLVSKATLTQIDHQIGLYVFIAFVVWVLVMAIFQYIVKINILKIAVLAGTMSLALAFAGNDLVNFIGVFMAGQSSFELASDVAVQGGNVDSLMMGDLAKPVSVDWRYLLVAGLIMVGALAFSKKARTVTETEVNLAKKKSGMERFGSVPPARVAVRYALCAINYIVKVTPQPVAQFVGNRFKPLDTEDESGASFDLIRATVNLTVASLLISLATSLKLPLSTTYVTFMVAMGSSLADRAWGRDSAVYRITGVITVVGGWFFTALAAFTAALIVAFVLMYAQTLGIILMLMIVVFMLVKSSLMHKSRTDKDVIVVDLANDQTLERYSVESAETLGKVVELYQNAMTALYEENRKALKSLRKESKNLLKSMNDRSQLEVIPTLETLPIVLADRGQVYYRAMECQLETIESLNLIISTAFSHIDNNHRGLSEQQRDDLLLLNNRVAQLYPNLCMMLKHHEFTRLDQVLDQTNSLSDDFAESIRKQLLRNAEDPSRLRVGILYLSLLSETRTMIRKSYLLLDAQKDLMDCPILK